MAEKEEVAAAAPAVSAAAGDSAETKPKTAAELAIEAKKKRFVWAGGDRGRFRFVMIRYPTRLSFTLYSAERFGTEFKLSDKEKIALRQQRFGVTTPAAAAAGSSSKTAKSNGSATDSKSTVDAETLKKRAERYDMDI